MIPVVEYEADGHKYLMRGIRLRDQFVLAEILRDRADDGTGIYGVAHAQVHCHFWTLWNDEFVGLPTDVPRTLSWMLDVDGETVGMCRIGYWFSACDILYMAVHPDHRGEGLSTVMNLMLRTLIEPMGVKSISFKALASAPQVVAHAEERLELKPAEKETGLTGQEVTKYEFTAEQQAERLKDPKHADELIEVKVESVPEKAPPETDDDPKLDQPATPADQAQPAEDQKKP